MTLFSWRGGGFRVFRSVLGFGGSAFRAGTLQSCAGGCAADRTHVLEVFVVLHNTPALCEGEHGALADLRCSKRLRRSTETFQKSTVTTQSKTTRVHSSLHYSSEHFAEHEFYASVAQRPSHHQPRAFMSSLSLQPPLHPLFETSQYDGQTDRTADTDTQRHSDTRRHEETQRHRDTETQRHRDTETQRHRDTETQRHRDTETQRHRDTETQRHRHTDACTDTSHVANRILNPQPHQQISTGS